MEIAILVVLFLVGTVGGAMQALRYLDRRRDRGASASARSDAEGKNKDGP